VEIVGSYWCYWCFSACVQEKLCKKSIVSGEERDSARGTVQFAGRLRQ
jgi:hypothetical protein